MTTKVLGFAPLMFLACAAVACGGAGDEADGAPGGAGAASGDVALGPDGMPVGPDGKPLAPKLDGKYELGTQLDLTSAGVFPDPANDTLKALSNFKEKPTQTLVDLMDAANVPVVPTVLNAIPAVVRDKVLGWIDENIIASVYGKVPFAESMTSMLDDLASITTRFEVVTTLDLPAGDAVGNAAATNTFTGIAWRWKDKRTFIGAPEVVKQLETESVEANAVTLEKRSPELETGRLRLGAHRFSIPFGGFALLAVDKLAADKLGAKDLRDALGKIVDCKAIAADVSKRCVDPPGPGKVCVDHESELETLCTKGLDVLTSNVRKQIERLDLPLLALHDGHAQMWDAPAEGGPLDATIDRIEKGFWTASVGAGRTDKPILATWNGRRVGDTANPSR